VLGSYTFGKSLDQSSNLGEQVYPYNYRLTRAPSSFDITHDFVASYRYDVPFDKLFRHANKLTEGWAISGITRFSTGLPVTLINPNDTALIGSYNNGANSADGNINDSTFGQVISAMPPRLMQVSLKFRF
jgi:hypothetical protein